MSFKVRIIDRRGESIRGARVRLEFTDLLRGMSDQQYTDSDGIVCFDSYDDGPVRIYINGKNAGEYLYENGNSVTITR